MKKRIRSIFGSSFDQSEDEIKLRSYTASSVFHDSTYDSKTTLVKSGSGGLESNESSESLHCKIKKRYRSAADALSTYTPMQPTFTLGYDSSDDTDAVFYDNNDSPNYLLTSQTTPDTPAPLKSVSSPPSSTFPWFSKSLKSRKSLSGPHSSSQASNVLSWIGLQLCIVFNTKASDRW